MSRHKETIPTVDISLLSYDKESVLSSLRHALMDYGFFYLVNYDDYLSHDIIEALFDQSERFFNLPQKDKNDIKMVNSKHFLGYNGLEKEITGGFIDWREQIDFCSTDAELSRYDHLYENLVGPNQYPDANKLPYFKNTIKYFLEGMDTFSVFLMKLIFESLSVEPEQYSRYFNIQEGESNFNKMKLIRYPSEKELQANENFKQSPSSQGCGPHKDSDFLTYLFSPTQITSLQVQSLQGDWIPVQPIPKSIIINVGQTLEFLTSGVCISSIHRVQTSSKSSRISIPFFQNVKIESVLKPLIINEKLLKLRDERDRNRNQSVSFQFKPSLDEPIAVSVFKNRIKSHRDVSAKWWIKELAMIDQETLSANVNIDTMEREKNPELLGKVLKLIKIFKTFYSILLMELMRTSGDQTLFSFVARIKLACPFVKYDDLLRLFTIWPDFIVIRANSEGDVIIDLDMTDKVPHINDMEYMNSQFEIRCEKWIKDNEFLENVPPLQLQFIKPEVDEAKLEKEAEIRKKQGQILKLSDLKVNKPSKVNKKSNSTMSILERIRLKEKLRKENYQSPQVKRDQYLDSKIFQVINIIFALSKRSLSIARLSEIIKNSLSSTSALSLEDSEAIIKRICVKFPDVFTFVNGKSLKVLKWNEFQLTDLKNRLENSYVPVNLNESNGV